MDVCIVGLVCTGGVQTRRTVTHGLLQGAVRGGESGEKFYPAVRENTFFFFSKMVTAEFNGCESGSVLSWLSACPERKLLGLSFGHKKFL